MLGKKRFQPFFEKLYYLSKFGKNIGLPIDVKSSGEVTFIKTLGDKWRQQKEFIFFDIGANQGVYTEHILQDIQGNKHCYLFEPQSALCKELNKKFAGNNHVTVIEKGCGNDDGNISLFSFEGADTLASAYSSFKGTIEARSSETIEIIRLDDFFMEHSVTFIDLIKIDVEGYELEVMKGMSRYLSGRKINIIQFEFGSFNIASRTFFKDFWELLHDHYSVYRILKDGLFEIKAYSPDLEIFDTTNYAAILKQDQTSG